MNNARNVLTADSYKYSHFNQYPQGAKFTSSYIEARGTKIDGVTETVFLGLQSYIKDFLLSPITAQDVRERERRCKLHGVPFNTEGWMKIVNEHNGFLPILIEAVPEGTVVPLKNVLLQIRNTHPDFPWLPSFLETVLQMYIWYPSTVATMSREIKKVIKHYLDLTSDNPDAELPFKLHDFGFRGCSSYETAGRGGFAHLVNFLGTDTMAGIDHAIDYYNSDVCGYSIVATEHSTTTSWKEDGEFAFFKNMVKNHAKPGAIFACVIDSFDTFRAIDYWSIPRPGEEKSLLDQVKEAGATVVLRPDSGDPVNMPIQVIQYLLKKYGKYNNKGFAVLPDHVRVIQGDGIDINDVKSILERLYDLRISASNIAFGMGGGLLQKVNRDTFKFAMKCSAISFNNNVFNFNAYEDVVKNPKTDPEKKSKGGVLRLIRNLKTGNFSTVNIKELKRFDETQLETIYENLNGDVFVDFTTMEEIRERAKL